MKTALKICERIAEAGCKISGENEKLSESLTKLAVAQEDGEKVKAEVHFSVKFRKSLTTGIPMNGHQAHELTEKVKAAISEISGECTTCKAHTPRNTKAPAAD